VADAELYKKSDAVSLPQHKKVSADYALLLSKAQEILTGSRKEVTSQMNLYLDNPPTQNLLLKPISRKVIHL
jgi:hypothetical protein